MRADKVELDEDELKLYGSEIAGNVLSDEVRVEAEGRAKKVLENAVFNLDAALDSYDPTFPRYTPSEEAFEFFNLMRLVQGSDFEFSTPIVHYFMADLLLGHITDKMMFPYSEEVCRTIELDELRLGFMASRGLAKALPLDYPVMSEYGNKTIGNIKIGETIFDGEGKLCKVTGKSQVFIDKPMYRITLRDGRVLDMSEDHINIVWKKYVRQISSDKSKPIISSDGGKRFKPVMLSGIREITMTAKELYEAGVTTNRAVTAKNTKDKEAKYWVPNVGLHAEYPETHFDIDPYTVGVILGDGSTEQTNGFTRITCHDDDYDHYQKFIPYKLGTYTQKKGTKCGMFSLLGLGPLIKKFVGIDRSYTKRVPIPLKMGSRHQRLEVLRGLMDTDGSAYAGSGTCAFDSVSKGLAEDVQYLVRSLGGSAQIKENKTSSKFGISYRVKISINEAIFKLPRKLERVQYRNDKYCVAIISIEKIDSRPTQCISVDSPSQSFITKDWTVTHNSTLVISFFGVYSAIKGKLTRFGNVYFYLVLAASSRGGARVNALAVRAMCEDSLFLKDYFEDMRFTESESEFVRKDVTGKVAKKDRSFLIRYQGINTGVRGSRYGERRPDCHVAGTVVTTEYGTYHIEAHPGEMSRGHFEICTKVKLRGLPDSEIVSNDHQYWAKLCVGNKCVMDESKLRRYSETGAKFTKTSELTDRHWIGSVIDYTVNDIQPIPHSVKIDGANRDSKGQVSGSVYETQMIKHKYMDTTDWWWLYGLWLGDGTLGTARSSQVIWYVANSQEDTVGAKVCGILQEMSISHSIQRDGQGCYSIVMSNASLYRWLKEHKGGNSIKTMPEWVLKIDLDKQKQILLGYISSDGYIDLSRSRQVRINSVNYKVLRQLQVIGARLGLPSHIRTTKKACTQYFKSTDKTHQVNKQWEIRFKDNVESVLGIKGITDSGNFHKQVHIKDGMLWRQVESTEQTEEEYELVPIQCDNSRLGVVVGDNHVYETEFGVSHNCILLDDAILNTAAAYSKVLSENLEDIIHSDSVNALKGGGRGRIMLCFTPFHYGDVNTKALLQGAFTQVVLPLSSAFDADKDVMMDDIQSSWEAMHPAGSIKKLIVSAKRAEKIGEFMQERMLRLSSSSDRLIPDSCLQWYDSKMIADNIHAYNVYITTDYTTTSGEKSDFSGIATWAVSNNEDWFLLNLTLRKRTMEAQYMETLREAAKWTRRGKYVEIGVEVDGNQSAHVYSLERLMAKQGTWYSFAKQKGDPNSMRKGILSRGTGVVKHERFRIASQLFRQKKVWFPNDFKDTPDMIEFLAQIRGATHSAFTRADDGPDLCSMALVSMEVVYPTADAVEYEPFEQVSGKYWGKWEHDKEDSGSSVIF